MLRCTPSRRISQYNFGQPSLSRAFGPIAAPRALQAPSALKWSTLGNGVRIVTHDLDGAHSAIGVYADAGPKYDPRSAPGMSYVIRFAIQTSNYDNSLFQIDRAMRSVGNAYGHGEIRKRHLVWKTEGRRDMWAKPFEMIATGIAAPRFHEADIERFRDTMDNQLEEQRWKNPRDYAIDSLETVAFFKEPLGNPRMVPDACNDKASAAALLDHWAALFAPKNIVIAGVNVNHEELVAAYEALPYPHSAEAPHFAKSAPIILSGANEETQFYPGREATEFENRAKAMGSKPDMEDEVIVALGSTTYGAESELKHYAAALVAKEILSAAMGERGSFANGELLSTGVRVFYRPYSTTGLMGVTVQCHPKDVNSLLECVTGAVPASVSEAAVSAGRTRAEMAFAISQLELNRDYCDFIATSCATAEEMIHAIKRVTAADAQGALDKMRARQPAAFATGSTFGLANLGKLTFGARKM